MKLSSLAALELKIPPVVLVFIFAGLIWLTALVAPAYRFTFPGRSICSVGLALLGVSVSISGVISFKRARTTVNPTTPGLASSLVISGIYKFTRNPMYLGFLLILIAWAMFLANLLALLPNPHFVVYLNRFQIHQEERVLASLFKHEFATYAARVRRRI
jgi:protein-S-isoprenylcysteine O-methyltransferase Ste14